MLLLCGCHHEGYQKDRSLKAIHIFGIGWINDKTETNHVKAFGIGSLDATAFSGTTQTNAPYVFKRNTNQNPDATLVLTNAPPRTNVIVIKIEEPK